ncbi:DUF2933 domain-containing protein [Comamonas aquatica]|jgi:hypothetical protein|uniref:Protein of uncharacterized function (DUF2933) n=1 Tax=Comamonas aquatica TaxID=225991 RepID=A0A1B2D5L5_9BURK|nr:DUF2933 domain-containing protein [Comamonas aquatica]ANY63010.1 hypothetical protein MA05_14165 [Comamonas aquatica]CAB5708966.1 Protein of uncharacterised function (DUF2933) [Comamonas aquatica]CAC9203123.1 Protein of uncharacterised function (DUF2933) [Comamonas aquatica]CAC9688272.1 Protein of uncharacterised function (DUF2933) [Comamonas aquatica]
MHHDHSSPHTSDRRSGFWRSRYTLGMLVLGIVAGYFLWTEHRAHLQLWWPYALLLACPLMHVFMHKGHGGHGNQSPGSDEGRRSNSDRD